MTGSAPWPSRPAGREVLPFPSEGLGACGRPVQDFAAGPVKHTMQELAYPVQRDDMESRAPLDILPGYSFTPNSEAIVASYGGKVWRIAMDGSGATEIPFEADVKLVDLAF